MRKSESEERIIGGSNIALGGASFMASLRTISGVHFCGATIVSSLFVVTSAQCIGGRVAANIRIHVGTVSLISPGSTHIGNQLLPHPGFNPLTLDYE